MIEIKEKHDCCGCSACVQRCPKHCISLKEDEEGFLYPSVDVSECIDCGLCEMVCPWLSRPDRILPVGVLAVKNRNEGERMSSSSGGVFIAVARKVIENGGVVFGAVFDEKWEVRHAYAETLEGVRPMMGSKYLQSRIEDSYRQAEVFLKAGRDVLFSGSPCQIAGLHNYLRKDYPNLFAIDFICHGVPSPGVWRKYLDETFNISARRAADGKNTVLSQSLNSLPVITGIEFRDKKRHGWKKYSFVVRGSAVEADKNSVLLSDIHRDNPFMKGFLADIYLRPSCYQCKCKNGVSHSDLTIADFWGIQNMMPDFDDDKGVGLVLVNTDGGKKMFDSLDMEVRQSTLEVAKRFNGGFKEKVTIPKDRNKFFIDYCNGIEVYKLIKLYTRKKILVKIRDERKKKIRLIKRVLKKILGL